MHLCQCSAAAVGAVTTHEPIPPHALRLTRSPPMRLLSILPTDDSGSSRCGALSTTVIPHILRRDHATGAVGEGRSSSPATRQRQRLHRVHLQAEGQQARPGGPGRRPVRRPPAGGNAADTDTDTARCTRARSQVVAPATKGWLVLTGLVTTPAVVGGEERRYVQVREGGV